MNKRAFFLLVILLASGPAFAQETYDIQLKYGDNLIGLPLVPVDSNISSVLSAISTQVKDVWEFNPNDIDDHWKHYQPGKEEYSDLKQMDAGKGYWINVKTNVTLRLTGTPVPENEIVSLKEGWNVAGWPYQSSQEINAALCALSIGVDYDQVSRLNNISKIQENFMIPPAVSDFTVLDPAKGYCIYMYKDKTIRIGLLDPVDTTPPQGFILINGGYMYTNTTSVNLLLSATDSGSGMGQGAQMQLSNDGVNWTNPDDYILNKNWTLLPGDGTKTVYAKFKDVAGNWSQAFSDTIVLDTSAPVVTAIYPQDGAVFTEAETVNVSATVNDPDSSPLEYQFSLDGAIKQSWSAEASYTWVPAVEEAGLRKIKVEVRDAGGSGFKESEIYVFRKPVFPSGE